jgi:CRP/FNR family transcriptional regulator, cyclic AMP receptor protein
VKGKFTGPAGTRRLNEALREQPIVEHDEKLAAELAKKGKLVEFASNDILISQGDHDNEVFFLIVGEVEISVNGRIVATRVAGQSIGEMAMLSPVAQRSATATATQPTLALRLDEPSFQTIATAFPGIWRPIGRVVADRLRQRERFHLSPNPTPILFLGSSVEGLPVANEIVSGLKHANVIPRIWSTPGIFSPGGVSIDVLLKEVDNSDFSAFVFGPDDKIASRGVKYFGPRDNVVFELGLFMGRLDRTRSFIIKEHSTQIKIPSDLLGVTPITYVSKAGQDLPTTIRPVCIELESIVMQAGPR